MSSFICNPKHFNTVEYTIQQMFMGAKKSEYSYTFSKYIKTQSGVDNVCENITRFIDTLKELQVLCVTLQYKHHYEGVLDAEISSQRQCLTMEKRHNGSLRPHALIKALKCINYQIETEHLSELRDLTEDEKTAMKMLDNLTKDLCYYIVSNEDAYENSEWEIQ